MSNFIQIRPFLHGQGRSGTEFAKHRCFRISRRACCQRILGNER